MIVPNNNYDGALEKRLDDTGSWIFKEDFFVKWKQSEDSVLRLIGKRESQEPYSGSLLIMI